MSSFIRIIFVTLLIAATGAAMVKTVTVLHNNQVARDAVVAKQKAIEARTPTVAAQPSSSGMTLAQVALHKTTADCWIVISDKIYNVSSFLNQHPGGVSTILPYCGKEATTAFKTHGRSGGSNHSAYAYSLLPSYFVTTIGSKAPPTNTTKTTTQTKSPVTTAPKVVNPVPKPTPPASGYTRSQVAMHSTQGSCWIIISGKVYNVTPFLSSHPGGVSTITPFCGADATIAFQTHGRSGGSNHSAYAYSLLPTYYVGELSIAPVVPGTFTLSVTKSGTGLGTVSGSGITCGITCSATANSGTSITLTATAASGSTFTGWSGACSGTGSCVVSLSADKSVNANFDTTVVTPPTPPAGTTYTAAQVASHSSQGNCWIIISNNIYDVTSFLSLHPGGVSSITPYCGQEATTAFQTHGRVGGSNHSAYAYSLLPTYYVGTLSVAPVTPGTFTLSVTKSGTGTGTVTGGTISCGATCSATANSGTSITLTATAASGSTFTGWSGACTGTGSCVVSLTANKSVNATFDTSVVTPPPPPPPAGTTYTTAQVATHNTQGNCWLIISGKVYNVTSFISAHPGGANAIVSRCGSDATTVFTTNGGGGHAHSAYAYSLLPTYYVGDVGTAPPPPPPVAGNSTLSVTSANGTVTSSPAGISCGATCSANFVTGTSVTLSAAPNPGYTFSGWSGACTGTGSCTVTLSSNQSVTASYTATGGGGGGGATTYTVHVTSSGNYDVTNLTIHVGDSITFVYSPPIGDEVITAFSPAGVSSVTLDAEFTQRTRTFNSAGTWTYRASGKSGNQGTLVVQ